MLQVCQDQIRDEIKAAPYFAIVADETSDVSNVFEMVIVLRYLVDGRPKERFYTFLQPSGHDLEFFSVSPQRTVVLDEIVGKRLPRAVPTRWNFGPRCVCTVYENKADIIKCLTKLRDESLNHQTIQQSSGFLKTIQDKSFSFWLKFFHPVMLQVDILYSFLQKRDADAVGARNKINLFEQEINKIRNQMKKVSL